MRSRMLPRRGALAIGFTERAATIGPGATSSTG